MKINNCFLPVLLISLSVLVTDLFAQSKEIEEMWRNLIDSTKIDFRNPVYLSISEEEILQLLDHQLSFGMHRDNYFIAGIPTNKNVSKATADAKFQISVRQRLTKTILPFNSFLMLTYTQKSFWDIFMESAPFADNNYNPGLTLAKPIVTGNKLRGMASFAFEHESNGKDSIDSRDCNYFVLSGIYFFNASLSVQGKLWAGFLGNENKDLWSKYRGYGLVALNYRSLNDKFWMSAVINPYRKLGDFNTQLELNFKLNHRANQYLFVQWYQGYGESLTEYRQYTSMVRVGICIKPPLRNLY
jgi:phospholipase A1